MVLSKGQGGKERTERDINNARVLVLPLPTFDLNVKMGEDSSR